MSATDFSHNQPLDYVKPSLIPKPYPSLVPKSYYTQEKSKKKSTKKKYSITTSTETPVSNENILKEQKQKLFNKLKDFKNAAGIYSSKIRGGQTVGFQRNLGMTGADYGPMFGPENEQEDHFGEPIPNFDRNSGTQRSMGGLGTDFGFQMNENQQYFGARNKNLNRKESPLVTNSESVTRDQQNLEDRKLSDLDNQSEGMVDNFKVHDVYRRGDHHEGITGPVHTYQKTNKHAHFKWGVKHHVGHQFA